MIFRRILVVGPAEYSEPCSALAAESYEEVVTVIARRISGTATFDLSELAAYPATEWSAFAAAGNELLNLSRLSLMSQLVGAGYALAGLVSKRSSIPVQWLPERNTLVSAGAVIGHGAKIRHNVTVGAAAVIGVNARLGHSVWVGAGAIVGDGAAIGDGTIIGMGAVVLQDVSIGLQCEVAAGQLCSTNVDDRSLYSTVFEAVARVYPLRSTRPPASENHSV